MNEQPANLIRLLAAQREGDEVARAAVLEPFQPWLRLLARLQIDGEFHNKFDASDIAQQTLLEAYRDLPKFCGQSETELLAWLRQILAHVLAHEIRRYQGTQQRDKDREISLERSLAQSSLRLGALIVDRGPTPSQQAVAREQEVVLAEVLARLPEEYREVIVLRNLEELPHEEIARRMGRSAGAVRMLWLRALAQLRLEIGDSSILRP